MRAVAPLNKRKVASTSDFDDEPKFEHSENGSGDVAGDEIAENLRQGTFDNFVS